MQEMSRVSEQAERHTERLATFERADRVACDSVLPTYDGSR